MDSALHTGKVQLMMNINWNGTMPSSTHSTDGHTCGYSDASAEPTFVYIGASTGVGFYAYKSTLTLRSDAHAILLLRSVNDFCNSKEWQGLCADVQARTTLMEGDALSETDVRTALWGAMGGLEGIVYSLSHKLSQAVGIKERSMTTVFPRGSGVTSNCCQGLIVLLRALYDMSLDYRSSLPKLVVVSSMGVGRRAFQQLPIILQPLFSHVHHKELKDKLAMEVILSQCFLRLSTAFRSTRYVPRFFPSPSEVSPSVFALDASSSLPRPFLLPPEVCVVRPSLLTNGRAKGRGRYRVVQEDKIKSNAGWWGMYFISREDVGGFVGDLFNPSDERTAQWWGHQVALAY